MAQSIPLVEFGLDPLTDLNFLKLSFGQRPRKGIPNHSRTSLVRWSDEFLNPILNCALNPNPVQTLSLALTLFTRTQSSPISQIDLLEAARANGGRAQGRRLCAAAQVGRRPERICHSLY